MNWKTKAYIGVELAVGAAALGRGLFLWSPWDLPRFICYLVLAVVASGLKVSLPGVTGTMSVLSIFLLGAVSELNLQEALVIGIICILVQCYWHAKVRPKAIQCFFSVANIAFAIAATEYIYHLPMILVLQGDLGRARSLRHGHRNLHRVQAGCEQTNRALRQDRRGRPGKAMDCQRLWSHAL